MRKVRLFLTLAAPLLLAACFETPAAPSPCVITARMFCVGIIAKSFQVSVEERKKSIDGSIYVVNGIGRGNEKNRFVAIVRHSEMLDLDSRADRMRLCQLIGIDAKDCIHSPLRTIKYQYKVLYEGHREPILQGIRVDLISAAGVTPDLAMSLAFPCAGTDSGGKVCGPHLGTCIRRRGSIGCDFVSDFGASLWKWRWRYL